MFEDTFVYIIDHLQSSTFLLASAGIIAIFGLYFGSTLGGKARDFVVGTKLNRMIKNLGWDEPVGRVWRGGTVAGIFGKAIEIWIYILFAMTCTGILQMDELSRILGVGVLYFFNVMIAFLIFAVAVFLADLSKKTLIANLEKEKFVYSHFLSRCVSGTIWTLAILAILYQLKIIAPLVLAVFVGIVITISIAAGVALGFGGRELAAKILKEIEERLK
ncbi:MAG: hypothetical protein MUD10_01025 [Candidatus Pacebacteria bacterium]|jgi:hypothetical protein|nr:hypothetical protein [Candidatus Paceibacterota bacterium]